MNHSTGTLLKLLKSLAISTVAVTAGCATYVRHLCDEISPASTFVTLESTPPGATAKLSNGRVVTTPVRIVLRNGEDVSVTFTKEGYAPATAEIGGGINPWVFGDLIALPPFGFFIDAEQGAMGSLYPKTVSVDLVSLVKRP